METTLTIKFRSADPGKQEALFEAFDLVCMNPTDRRKYDGIADKDAEFLTRIEKLSEQEIPKNDLGYLGEIMEPESIMKRKNIILYYIGRDDPDLIAEELEILLKPIGIEYFSYDVEGDEW